MYEKEVFEVYKFSGILSFPVDIYAIVKAVGYDTKTYQEISKDKKELIEHHLISNDAYVSIKDKTIYINDNVMNRRKRFSIAHELGHVIMVTDDEKVVNDFASNLLAPRPIIYALGLRTADEVSKYFDISISAANVAIQGMWVTNPDEYYPDVYGADMIKYFGYAGRFPWLYPEEQESFPMPDKLPPAPEKTRDDIIAFRKKKRSLEGKIKRLRLKLVTETDEKKYRQIKDKLGTMEMRLDMLMGRSLDDY